nr:60S ribosomal protein L34 [Tanacetum cinerariifolium]
MRISITFHHDGIFTPSPLMYKEEDAFTIRDIEFEGMTLIGLLKKLKGACQFPVKCIYFRILGKELSNGLVEIKDDSNLADCIALAFKNEKLIEIYLEHHGYDLSHWVQTKIEDDEVSDVGEMEDISHYGPCDFVGDDDELLINSNDEGVDTMYKVVDDVLYPEFDPSLPWNEMKPTLEGRCGGKKGKKGDLPAKKGKVEDVQIESPSKGNKGKKGVQSPGKKGKGVLNLGSTIQHQFYTKMNLIDNIDPEAKQWLVDRNPNS